MLFRFRDSWAKSECRIVKAFPAQSAVTYPYHQHSPEPPQSTAGARLVVFDSLVRFMASADTNDATAIALVTGGLRSLTNAHGCAMLVLAHLLKSSASTVATALETVHGSGDIVAAVDSVFILRGIDSSETVTVA